jgi:hypothetical protein
MASPAAPRTSPTVDAASKSPRPAIGSRTLPHLRHPVEELRTRALGRAFDDVQFPDTSARIGRDRNRLRHGTAGSRRNSDRRRRTRGLAHAGVGAAAPRRRRHPSVRCRGRLPNQATAVGNTDVPSPRRSLPGFRAAPIAGRPLRFRRPSCRSPASIAPRRTSHRRSNALITARITGVLPAATTFGTLSATCDVGTRRPGPPGR